MKKKILTLLTLFVVVLGVSACGGSSLPSEVEVPTSTLDQIGGEFRVRVGSDIKTSKKYNVVITNTNAINGDTATINVKFGDEYNYEPVEINKESEEIIYEIPYSFIKDEVIEIDNACYLDYDYCGVGGVNIKIVAVK